jgi:hypothetical protein
VAREHSGHSMHRRTWLAIDMAFAKEARGGSSRSPRRTSRCNPSRPPQLTWQQSSGGRTHIIPATVAAYRKSAPSWLRRLAHMTTLCAGCRGLPGGLSLALCRREAARVLWKDRQNSRDHRITAWDTRQGDPQAVSGSSIRCQGDVAAGNGPRRFAATVTWA